MSNQIGSDKQLGNICNAIAESYLELSDDELLAELEEEGVDVEAESEKVKQIFRDTLGAFKQ